MKTTIIASTLLVAAGLCGQASAQITTFLYHGDLVVRGTSAAEAITVHGSSITLSVLGDFGTTVNGASGATFTNLFGRVLIDMDGGDDQVFVSDSSLPSSLVVRMGADSGIFFAARNTIAGDLAIDAGTINALGDLIVLSDPNDVGNTVLGNLYVRADFVTFLMAGSFTGGRTSIHQVPPSARTQPFEIVLADHTTIHHPHAIGAAVARLDRSDDLFHGGHVDAVAVEDLVSQRDPLAAHHQRDAHLLAIGAVIAAIAASGLTIAHSCAGSAQERGGDGRCLEKREGFVAHSTRLKRTLMPVPPGAGTLGTSILARKEVAHEALAAASPARAGRRPLSRDTVPRHDGADAPPKQPVAPGAGTCGLLLHQRAADRGPLRFLGIGFARPMHRFPELPRLLEL